MLLTATAASAADDPPASLPDAPINIFLNTPADFNSLGKVLGKPDYVILRGDQYNRLMVRPGAPGGVSAGPLTVAVGSVAVSGEVQGDLADLVIELGVKLEVEGPVWVPLRLDGQTLTRIREGEKEFEPVAGEGAGWRFELSGRGKHSVRVGLLAPVRTTPEGRRLELVLPEASSTRLSIDVPQRVSDAVAGPGEPLAREPSKGSGWTRLTGVLTPRPRVALVWKAEEAPGSQLPPLLVAQGEIAVDVDPGSFRTRSSWSIRSLRGTTRTLELRLDPEDEVLELELDGQPPPAGIERVGGATRMTIPLAEPLAPGQERLLKMTTRRSLPPRASAKVSFTGFPLTNAREQSGPIGISTKGDLYVTGVLGRGVRQIDPRTELRADLRARPGTALAYRFSEQPFELALRVEPSPPLIRVEARTTVALEPGWARVDTWLDLESARGRLFDLNLGLPAGLEVKSVGPAEVVSSWQTGPPPPALFPGAMPIGFRLLSLRLGQGVQEGVGSSIHLTGRQTIDPAARDVPVALFQPIGVMAGGGRIAVLTAPSLTAEPSEGGEGAGGVRTFRPAAQAPPADWAWPPGQTPATAPVLWLRYDDSPPLLPLRVTAHPRTLNQATTLNVRVNRREAEVRQETECSVRFGSLDHLDVTIPAAIAGRWEVEGAGVAQRTETGRTPRGDRTFRLKLATELTRSARYRFRYRAPLGPRLLPETPTTLSIPWVRVDGNGGPAAPTRLTVVAEPGLAVETDGASWTRVAEPEPAGGEGGSSVRLVATGAGAKTDSLVLRVTARALAVLPKLVAPRLAIRTVQGAEGDLRTTARYWVETHESSLSVALPPGADLEQARVGGEPAGPVERLTDPAGIRVAFPARVGAGPALVELDYAVSAARAAGPWEPPRLLEGGVVQQTLWEVRLPWNRAAVGVPAGWSDENEWFKDTYVWKRRPSRTAAALTTWPGAPPPRPNGPATVLAPSPADADPRGDDHGYLFGRSGGPAALSVRVAARTTLVAVCSGSVLVVGGFLVLVWRPAMRLFWFAAIGLGLWVAALLHPSVTFLAVQSGMVGLLLTALIVVMQRLVDRRGPRQRVYGEPNSRVSARPGSTLSRSVGVGSDDSTAIRVRNSSTLDHISVSPPAPRAEHLGRGGREP